MLDSDLVLESSFAEQTDGRYNPQVCTVFISLENVRENLGGFFTLVTDGIWYNTIVGSTFSVVG